MTTWWRPRWANGVPGLLDQELQARKATARVVQLPQSMFYLDPQLGAQDNAVIQQLRAIDLTLHVRQWSSLEYAPPTSDRVRVKVIPDIAFLLSETELGARPASDVLILLREDHERAPSGVSNDEAAHMANSTLTPINASFQVRDWVVSGTPQVGELEISSPNTFPLVRCGMAQRLIMEAKVLITDRLHASIVALLMDRPHIMIDNSYGKISGVRHLALPGHGGACGDAIFRAQWARDIDEALVMARRILLDTFVIS